MQSHPYPNHRFWQCVSAVVIVALSASVSAVSQRVDYDWRSGRMARHFVTVNLLGSAILLTAVASSRPHAIPGVTARIVSLQIGAYTIVGFLLAVRRVKDLVRAPKLIVFAVIVILSWWWAP